MCGLCECNFHWGIWFKVTTIPSSFFFPADWPSSVLKLLKLIDVNRKILVPELFFFFFFFAFSNVLNYLHVYEVSHSCNEIWASISLTIFSPKFQRAEPTRLRGTNYLVIICSYCLFTPIWLWFPRMWNCLCWILEEDHNCFVKFSFIFFVHQKTHVNCLGDERIFYVNAACF